MAFQMGDSVQFILDGSLRMGTVVHTDIGTVWIQEIGIRQPVKVPSAYVMSAEYVEPAEYDDWTQDVIDGRDWDADAEYAEYLGRFGH